MNGCHFDMTTTGTSLNFLMKDRIEKLIVVKFRVNVKEDGISWISNGSKQVHGVVQCSLIVDYHQIKYPGKGTTFQRGCSFYELILTTVGMR